MYIRTYFSLLLSVHIFFCLAMFQGVIYFILEQNILLSYRDLTTVIGLDRMICTAKRALVYIQWREAMEDLEKCNHHLGALIPGRSTLSPATSSWKKDRAVCAEPIVSKSGGRWLGFLMPNTGFPHQCLDSKRCLTHMHLVSCLLFLLLHLVAGSNF